MNKNNLEKIKKLYAVRPKTGNISRKRKTEKISNNYDLEHFLDLKYNLKTSKNKSFNENISKNCVKFY